MNRRARTEVIRNNRIFGISILKNGYPQGTVSAYYARKLAKGGTYTGYARGIADFKLSGQGEN